MPVPRQREYTAEDYWNLPDDVRAELIDGQLYDMAPPSWTHQKIVSGLVWKLRDYVERNGRPCQVVSSPVAVNLDANDETWVEPDVIVVCDPTKVSERGCEGAPDLVIEVVSPSSISRDYFIKAGKYRQAGVREYWIVDPATQKTTVYRYGPDSPVLSVFAFFDSTPVGIFDGLEIAVADLL